MFNSAGMVPYKPYFLGLRRDLSRAASCQKCFRTTDIDRVGQTLRHLTFFEMLGNFSFGDYFKAEAIAWAWELLTREMGLDPGRLHPTVFLDDNEAADLWKKQPLENPVLRLGEESNFWAVGPTGPCGPCSEIYFDRGAERGCGQSGCAPGCDCDRYLELWNLVFMQFDRQADGGLKPLPRQNIDTGMGLERLAFVAQAKDSPFDTDLFSPVTASAIHILGLDPGRSPDTTLALRVIADHARAAIMLMSEGVIPSNVERGYVLRRLIRRAVRYGQLMGCQEPFLHRLVPSVVEVFQSVYPEIAGASGLVSAGLRMEEERFLETLGAGERELRTLLENASNILPGEQAFKLYDTFGFPLELTREICAQRGLKVDEEGFQKAKEDAAEIARASWKGSGAELGKPLAIDPAQRPQFTGYDSLEERTEVLVIETESRGQAGRDGKPPPSRLALKTTPFYAESGGQVGDTGQLLSPDGRSILAEIIDTVKQGDVIVHLARIEPGQKIAAGDQVIARVDAARRKRIMSHHTATHLLNTALRQVLGVHVRQAGSYVDDKRLRFDFTHPKALSPEEIARVEAIVNDEIGKALPVAVRRLPAAQARELGAITLLGEDYGELPRFVLIGPKGWEDPHNRFSLELCGGTHAADTAQIESFKIVRESSVAAGIRRIEALAGPSVTEHLRQRAEARQKSLAQLRERQDELIGQIRALGGSAEAVSGPDEPSLRARLKDLENALRGLKARKFSEAAEGRRVMEIKSVKLCVQKLEGADPRSLRGICDRIKSELGSGVVFLAAPHAGKISFVLCATNDLAGKRFDAAAAAKRLCAAHGGSAGGRADFAQGGLPDADWDRLVASLASLL